MQSAFAAEPRASIDPSALDQQLSPLEAGERIEILASNYASRLVASTSFGLQATVMLSLLLRHAPDTPVIFIDTGFLFDETYRYAEELMERFPLDYRIYQPKISAARVRALWGDLWSNGGADRYALITKIEPMNRALTELGADVWISGLRRSQSGTRAKRALAEAQKRTTKVYPILDWTDGDVAAYFTDQLLPRHPLEAEGFVTMGDWHSTRPATPEEAAGSRFDGQKFECGLHLDSGSPDFQI